MNSLSGKTGGEKAVKKKRSSASVLTRIFGRKAHHGGGGGEVPKKGQALGGNKKELKNILNATERDRKPGDDGGSPLKNRVSPPQTQMAASEETEVKIRLPCLPLTKSLQKALPGKEDILLPLAQSVVVRSKAGGEVPLIRLPIRGKEPIKNNVKTPVQKRISSPFEKGLHPRGESRIPLGLVRERALDFEKRISALQEEQAARASRRKEARSRFFAPREAPPAAAAAPGLPSSNSSSGESNFSLKKSVVSVDNSCKYGGGESWRRGPGSRSGRCSSSAHRNNPLQHGTDFLIDDEIMDQPDLTISSLVKRTRDTLISLDGGESVSELAQETYGILKDLQPYESHLIPAKLHSLRGRKVVYNESWRSSPPSWRGGGSSPCSTCPLATPAHLNQDILSIKTYLLRLKRLLIENSSVRTSETELEEEPPAARGPTFKTPYQTLRERIFFLERQILEKDATIKSLRLRLEKVTERPHGPRIPSK